jgi:predicted RND superfamily exporter protein
MKSDFKELQTRQRLLAEEEKSSKENIEREKKEEREAIQMERERVLLEAKKEHQSAMLEAQKKAKVVEEEKKEWESEKKRIQETKTFEKIVTLNVGGTKYITSDGCILLARVF